MERLTEPELDWEEELSGNSSESHISEIDNSEDESVPELPDAGLGVESMPAFVKKK